MTPHSTYRQPWLQSPAFDGLYILFPGILALIITLLLPAAYKTTDKMPVIGWVVLVLLVDVAHVYSTLFRTYWDKQRFARHRTLYLAIPIACYIAGVLLYSLGPLAFWRLLAYLAVFHFVRQQYGFMRLYSRADNAAPLSKAMDTVAIYAATLYPLIWWHCTPGRNFNWFVDGDFVPGDSTLFKSIAFVAYLMIIAAYAGKEVYMAITQRRFNLPKNMLVAVTFITWYTGIIYFNGDMAFTLLNVVAHGIPYMALVWLFRRREDTQQKATSSPMLRNPAVMLAFFVLSIVLFAYLEEGLWDGFVWRDHGSVFGLFAALPQVTSQTSLALLVPLLSLPQSTHYVLDGFIWRKGHTR